jgi:hypothetical protein
VIVDEQDTRYRVRVTTTYTTEEDVMVEAGTDLRAYARDQRESADATAATAEWLSGPLAPFSAPPPEAWGPGPGGLRWATDGKLAIREDGPRPVGRCDWVVPPPDFALLAGLEQRPSDPDLVLPREHSSAHPSWSLLDKGDHTYVATLAATRGFADCVAISRPGEDVPMAFVMLCREGT